MKTAMQELIDELDLVKIVDKNNFFMVKYIIQQCLKKEKEQISTAYNKGRLNEMVNTNISSKEYFNQTYKQNK